MVFDDTAVADFFDECVDTELTPERFARIWIHTHPGDSARPSGTDERTFARVFGGCDWAVMAILARGGESYARLRFNAGPGGELEISVEVDFGCQFSAGDPGGWQAEYDRCVVDAKSILRDDRLTDQPQLGDLATATGEPLLTGASRFPFLDLSELELWEYRGEQGY